MRVAPRNDTDNPQKGASGVFGGARKDGLSSLAYKEFDKLFTKLYRICYFVGIQFLRTMKRYKRNVRYYAKNNRVVHFFKSRNIKARLAAHFLELIDDLFTPFVNIARKLSHSKNRIAEKRKKSLWAAVCEFFGCARRGLLQLLHSLLVISHYVAPVLGVLFLIATIRYFSGLTFGLEVEYGGKTLGYVKSETDFEQAEKMMQGRIVSDASSKPIYTIPSFKVTVVDQSEFAKKEDICDELIKASNSVIVEAKGLYIDGQFYGAASDATSLSNTLKGLIDSQRTGDPTESVEFAQDVKLVPGLYPQTSVVDPTQLEQMVSTEVAGQQVYTVEEGDSPWSIADKVDVPLSDLLLLNPGIDKSLLIGQELVVSKAQPFLPIQVTKTVVYEDELPYEIVQNKSKSYNRGYTKITTKGEAGIQEVTARVTMLDGVQTDKVVLSTRVIKEAVAEQVTVGTKEIVVSGSKGGSTSSVVGTGRFMWPVVGGGSVSCGFMGYRGHTGTDIVLAYGAQIVAADDGVVVVAKRTAGGYGNHVMIDHGNGVQTLYGHMSKRYVSVGQTVKKGDVIGLMGNTGNVTGTHLHFEVRINGRYVNAMNYF